jgi:hypothetical protein
MMFMPADNNKPVTDVRLGQKKLYENNLGDTWDPAWGQDGSLYYPGNDGSGWNKACASNVFFNQSSGDDPFNLQSETTNCMLEYDGWAKHRDDGCTWKSSGCISVDGTLYLALGRHAYGTRSGDPHLRQTARRTSIIKSNDHGLTWTRSAEDNYHQPMFDTYFTTPYFIYYGQDGQAPAVDGADRYIYAVSNNGFWCNGDHYILGRIERANMPALNAADWSYYKGGDGAKDESWTDDPAPSLPIIENPLKCGETGATYLPALGRYILVAWYYPGDPNVDSDESHFIFYEAPHPWGPWTMIRESVSRPEGWYCPRVLAKWQALQEETLETILVTGGDYYEMSKYYRFTVAALSIKTDGTFPPEPEMPRPVVINNSDRSMRYTGSWNFDAERSKAACGGEYVSATPGDTLTVPFTGSRLQWHTSKENNLGIAAVSMDDGPETEVELWTYCHVPQYRRFVYDSGPLALGEHTFKVRVTGKKNEKSTGVGITHDWLEVTQ